MNPGGDHVKTAFSRSLDMAEEGTPTEEGATASQGQHWTNEEVAASLDIWSDDNIQAQLKGAYRNDAVMKKIAAGIVSRGFKLKRTAKQCCDKLKSLKKSYKDAIDKQRRSGAGIESDEEGMEDNFKFFPKLHSVLGTRAVVNPPVLLEIGSTSTSTSTGSTTTTPDATRANTPSTEEPTDECRQTEMEGSEIREPPEEVDNASTVQSSRGEPSRKKRKVTKFEKAEKDVTTALKAVMKQGSDLKDTLLALDDRRAKREQEQDKRENERDVRMMDF